MSCVGQTASQQPGHMTFNHFISVSQTDTGDVIVAYLPVRSAIKLHNPLGHKYRAQWFHPVTSDFVTAAVDYRVGLIEMTSPQDSDMVLVLDRE